MYVLKPLEEMLLCGFSTESLTTELVVEFYLTK